MSWWHADIWSCHDHYLVDPYTSPSKVKLDGHRGLRFNLYVWFSFCYDQTIFVWNIANFKIWSWIFSQGHGQVKCNGHIWGLGFNWYVCFFYWQSDLFWLIFSKFHIWPWKFKAKFTAKVKSDGHIWGLEFNQYICFLYVAIGPFLAKTVNSIFDLENSRSRSGLSSIRWSHLRLRFR